MSLMTQSRRDMDTQTDTEVKVVDPKFRGRKEASEAEKALKEVINALSTLNYDELEVTNTELVDFISNTLYDIIRTWKKGRIQEERGDELNAWEVRANNANTTLLALEKEIRKFRKYVEENKRTDIDEIFVYIGELCTLTDNWEAESPQRKRRKRKKLTES